MPRWSMQKSKLLLLKRSPAWPKEEDAAMGEEKKKDVTTSEEKDVVCRAGANWRVGIENTRDGRYACESARGREADRKNSQESLNTTGEIDAPNRGVFDERKKPKKTPQPRQGPLREGSGKSLRFFLGTRRHERTDIWRSGGVFRPSSRKKFFILSQLTVGSNRVRPVLIIGGRRGGSMYNHESRELKRKLKVGDYISKKQVMR